MLDKKLQDWREYQQYIRKVKLAKMDAIKTFPCLVKFENNYLLANLKIIENTTERYIHIVSRKRLRGLGPTPFFKIPLASLRGYEKQNSNIILTVQEEEEEIEDVEVEVVEEPILLQFASLDTLDAAFTAIEEFEREKVKELPTPSNTSSSDLAHD